ncbi:hypothetical protein HGK34_08290 [Myceligenerans sp. I2]|uniref:Lipoprotein n=2 Tax=Myceligenerans indicum TaxID=2593663 RepID=A0ABS1LJ84_9MICO|nr:hypothetical protein [Myceligenerans indicum]
MTRAAAPALALMFVLAGCSGGSDTGGDTGGYGAPAEESDSGDAGMDDGGMAAASLGVADTDLGTIVTDGDGMTVYQFDSDTQGSGESTCAGECLAAWPPVHGGDDVQADGVTGEIGTITGSDGEPQLTLDGWPLYYFASDTQPGDTMGQGVKGVWWVVTPQGEPVRE